MFEFRDAEHEFNTLEAMSERGGNFVKHLAQCYRAGDGNNKRKLREVFGNYFFAYSDVKPTEKPIDPKMDVSFTVEMSTMQKANGKEAHHLHVEGVGKPEDLEHLLMHLVADGKNVVGEAIRNIVKMGIPMTEEQARTVLGDDVIDYVKLKAEKEADAEEKVDLPN